MVYIARRYCYNHVRLVFQLRNLHAASLCSCSKVQETYLEEMKKTIFHFVIICCSGLFLLSILFNQNSQPDLEAALQVIGNSIAEFQNPISRVIDSFKSIGDFFAGGEIPDFIDVFRLFILPFEFMSAILRTIENILSGLWEVFQ
mgnify:CR=1 FL=1